MGFFDILNGEISKAFQNYAKSKSNKDRLRYNKFLELQTTPYLLDSSYLLELTDGANAAEQGIIFDYLYRFNNYSIGEDEHLDILGIDSYREVEQKLIDRKWK